MAKSTTKSEEETPEVSIEDAEKAKRKAERKHKRDLEKSGLSLKRPLKEGKVSPLTNPAVRQSLLNAGGSVAANAQQEINEAHDKVHPFISAKGSLEQLTIQSSSPHEVDHIRKEINRVVETFDGFNQALFGDGILRPDNKRARLGNEAQAVHKKITDLLTATLSIQEEVTNDFNKWQREQTKTIDVVEQLMQREIRERTHGMKEHELLNLAEEKPAIAKALINDPLSILNHTQRIGMIDKFLASVDQYQLDKRDTANENIVWLMKAEEHFDTKLRAIYQTAEMTKLMNELKSHGALAGKVHRRNSGTSAVSQVKNF